MTTNNDKILKALEKEKGLITTTELANKTNIDIRNITRYLKPLENKGIITRKTIQNGKIRVVKVELNKEKNKPKLILPKPIKVQDLKQPKPAIIEVVPEEDFFIDWDYLARNSSFQRGFTEFIKHTFPQYKKIDHRASKKVMNQQLGEKTNEITTALNIVRKIDSNLLRELRDNPLYLEQKSKNNK